MVSFESHCHFPTSCAVWTAGEMRFSRAQLSAVRRPGGVIESCPSDDVVALEELDVEDDVVEEFVVEEFVEEAVEGGLLLRKKVTTNRPREDG